MRAMSLFGKLGVGACSLILAAFVLGFFIFAAVVTRDVPPQTRTADGIVVLTGGARRISEAARLLRLGKAKRLLVSGVNRINSKSDIHKLTKLSPKMFACCVDLGYAAQNTRGNAAETREWSRSHNFASLIVVTASYHMPRSLSELSREMPSITLIPHAVVPNTFRAKPWWLDATNVSILVHEYLKFLPSAARCVVTRLVLPAHRGAVADVLQHADTKL